MEIINRPEIVVENEEKVIISRFLDLLSREYCSANRECPRCPFCRNGYCSVEQFEKALKSVNF